MAGNELDRRGERATEEDAGESSVAPGKRSLTEQLGKPRRASSPAIPGRSTTDRIPFQPLATPDQAKDALQSVEDILDHNRGRWIGGAPAQFQPFLHELLDAVVGDNNGAKIVASERMRLFTHAKAGLQPALAVYRQPSTAAWLQTHITDKLDRVQQSLILGDQTERVENATLNDHGKLATKEEEAEKLWEVIQELNEQIKKFGEQVIRHKHQHVESELEELEAGSRDPSEDKGSEGKEGPGPSASTTRRKQQEARPQPASNHQSRRRALARKSAARAAAKQSQREAALNPTEPPKFETQLTGESKFHWSQLLHAQHVFMAVQGYLLLNNKEFQHKLGNVQGFFPKAATYADFVSGMTGLAAGTTGTLMAAAAGYAKLAGQSAEVVNGLLHTSREIGHTAGELLSLIEVVHGVLVLCDDTSTREEKMDAAVDVASGASWLILSRVGLAGLGAGVSTGIMVLYYQFKLGMQLYGDSQRGLNGIWMNSICKEMEQPAESLATNSDQLVKCRMIRATETDPDRQAALKEIEEHLTQNLGLSLNAFITSCEPKYTATEPGGFVILQQAFASLQQYRSAKTAEELIHASEATLQQMTWVIGHAGALADGTVLHKPYAQVKAEEDERDKRRAEADHVRQIELESEEDKKVESGGGGRGGGMPAEPHGGGGRGGPR